MSEEVKAGSQDQAGENTKVKKETKEVKAGSQDQAGFYGNKDEQKKHGAFNPSWVDSVIARISQSAKIGPKSSDLVEIPSSIEYRPFEKSLFDTHIKQGMFDKMNVEVIHDPR